MITGCEEQWIVQVGTVYGGKLRNVKRQNFFIKTIHSGMHSCF